MVSPLCVVMKLSLSLSLSLSSLSPSQARITTAKVLQHNWIEMCRQGTLPQVCVCVCVCVYSFSKVVSIVSCRVLTLENFIFVSNTCLKCSSALGTMSWLESSWVLYILTHTHTHVDMYTHTYTHTNTRTHMSWLEGSWLLNFFDLFMGDNFLYFFSTSWLENSWLLIFLY